MCLKIIVIFYLKTNGTKNVKNASKNYSKIFQENFRGRVDPYILKLHTINENIDQFMQHQS